MKHFLKSMLLFLCLATALSAENPVVGLWKQTDEDTGKPGSIVAIYPYQGKYYGRILATYNEEGVIDNTIYNPSYKAPGVQGNPYYAGLDFIWDLKPEGNGNKLIDGKIMDPDKGRVYNLDMWVEDGQLVIRGKLLVFGRNQKWPPAKESDLPSGFKKPDLSKFVPEIHKVK